MQNDNIKQPEFGKRVRRLRQTRELSQQDFANSMGISQWTISRIENGVTPSGNSINLLEEEIRREHFTSATVSATLSSIAKSPEMRALVERIALEIKAEE